MSTKPTVEPTPAAADGGKNRYSRQIDTAFESASKLAGSSLPPAEFFEQFLALALQGIDAPAGAVWLRTPQGFLQIACQLNIDKVGLDQKRGGRQCHNEILRQVFQAQPPRPAMVEPQGRLAGLTAPPDAAGGSGAPPANLTDFWALFAPIANPDKNEKVPLGLVEVFQDPAHDPRLFPTFLNYLLQMAGYASQYHQFANARQGSTVEKVYAQVEAFSRRVHVSLNPTEVAYHVANEGRRLVECDRLCVGVRHGRKVTVEAVSGADVVEKASTHVRRMRALMDEVLKLDDKLVYKGEKDDGLPPALSRALDDYLAESQPKFLVVQPIRDEREEPTKDRPKVRAARSVVLMESFNPADVSDAQMQRLDVLAKHAAPALYNAAEFKRVPFSFAWRAVLAVQEAVGGKHRFYWLLGAVAAAGLAAAMVLVPYPLKLEAEGEFLPRYVKQVYAPHEGEVRAIQAHPGDRVAPRAGVLELFSPVIQEKYAKAAAEAAASAGQMDALQAQLKGNLATKDEMEVRQGLARHQATYDSQRKFQEDMARMYHLDPNRPGFFYAVADEFDAAVVRKPGAAWTVLSADNRDALAHRTVRPNEPLMRLGYTDGPWRVELKIPQRNIGHVAKALDDPARSKADKDGKRYLDVDVLLTSQPDASYRGRLYKDDIAGEAVPNKDDHNQSEPVVRAYVQVDLPDEPGSAIPKELFVAGQEVHTRLRCGRHALGYSLFHGVWEWFYEKVIFFF